MSAVNYLEVLALSLPEVTVVAAALAVITVDLLVLRGVERKFRVAVLALIAVFGCVIAGAFMAASGAQMSILDGMLVSDPLTRLVKGGLLVLAVFTVVLSMGGDFTEHLGEYFALILFATAGMMFLVGSEQLLMIFISLELTSLSLYILTAFNKRNPRSAEAALKYFLFGGVSAAVALFGMSLIYGVTGETRLPRIAAALAGGALDPLMGAAILMTVAGLGFKVAAAPFHFWAPDAYQGAPTPSAALIASGSKVASFFILARIVMVGFAGTEGSGAWREFVAGWMPLLAVVAVFSMVLGNLGAIVQTSVKRLLAYSAIAHAGYALLGILANSEQGVSALLYYTLTYGATVVGAFAVVSMVEDETGDASLSDFAGLVRQSPVLSLCMLVFLLSLAGIPPLAGFFGKFYLFIAVLKGQGGSLGMLWLVVFAIAMSAVSLYYYLLVLKQIYVAAPPDPVRRVRPDVLPRIVAVILAVIVVALGAAPDLIVGKLLAAIHGGAH